MPKYVLAKGPDVDLEQEEVRLPDGRRLTQEMADAIINETTSLRGRPSLTGTQQHSPRVSLRLTPAVVEGLDAIAERDGVSRSEVTRRALEDYVARSKIA
jgi:hypothetical protein